MQRLTRLILRRTCPYCHAMAGDWCHSPKSGKRARYLHAARGDQVYAAWRIGYREGVKDGTVMALERASDDLRRAGWKDVARWLQEAAREAEKVDPHE